MHKGKLIVLESYIDGSGKETQANKLVERLLEEGYMIKRYSYPDYSEWHSVFVRNYLNKTFCEKATDIDAKVAANWYAIDRHASYLLKWKEYYDEGYIILCDRYVSSNQIYQGAKLEDKEGLDEFLQWVEDLEYGTNKLPRPDLVVCLDLNPDIALENMRNRNNKINDSKSLDLHEVDTEFMKRCYAVGKEIFNEDNATVIRCNTDEMVMRTREEIHEDIYKSVKAILDK